VALNSTIWELFKVQKYESSSKSIFYTILRIQWKTTFPLIKLEVFHARLAGYLAMHLEKIRQRQGTGFAWGVAGLLRLLSLFLRLVDLRDFLADVLVRRCKPD
jgi:hypothetical protein